MVQRVAPPGLWDQTRHLAGRDYSRCHGSHDPCPCRGSGGRSLLGGCYRTSLAAGHGRRSPDGGSRCMIVYGHRSRDAPLRIRPYPYRGGHVHCRVHCRDHNPAVVARDGDHVRAGRRSAWVGEGGCAPLRWRGSISCRKETLSAVSSSWRADVCVCVCRSRQQMFYSRCVLCMCLTASSSTSASGLARDACVATSTLSGDSEYLRECGARLVLCGGNMPSHIPRPSLASLPARALDSSRDSE